MAIQLPSIPNFNVQQPDILGNAQKMLQLKSLQGQQQLQPYLLQEQQQKAQQAELTTQQMELAQKTQLARNAYWANPQNFQADAPQGGDQLGKVLGVADDDPLLGMVRGQIKAGVPGDAAIAEAKGSIEFRRTAAQATQDQQKILDDSHKSLLSIVTPIIAEKDPTKKAAMLDAARPGIAQAASFDPSLKPIIPQLNAQNIDAFGNRLGAEQGVLDLRSNSADLWKKELENAQNADPLVKMQNNPAEAFSGDKLPASIAYLQKRIHDPDPKVATQATQLLGVANSAKQVELSIDSAKKQAAQAIQDGDPVAAGKLLHDGIVSPSQLISSRKPEFAQKAFSAAAALGDGWNAQKAEADFKVASSQGNVAFFGSAKSLTDKGGTLDQLNDAAKDIPGGQIPIFNSIADAARAATGSGPVAKYASILLGVADDYSKVMGGGQGSDSSRAQALSLVPAKASPEARAAAIEGIRGAVGSQINSRIGNNPVLKQMYGSQMSSSAQSGGMVTMKAPNGATKQVSPDQVEHYKSLGATVVTP